MQPTYNFSCLQHPESSFYNVSYKGNYDGDTFKIDLPGLPDIFGKDVAVRLKHIDAPEIRTKDSCEKERAIEAKEVLREILTKAETIDLCEVERCKYFRIVAEVWADKHYVQSMLLEKESVVRYETPKPIDWCRGDRIVSDSLKGKVEDNYQEEDWLMQ